MSLIITDKNGNTQKLAEAKLENEAELQSYIANNPDVIPLDQVKQDPQFFVIAMEVGTQSGPIDAVGLDSDGELYLIETKLEYNTDKREIVAQIFDYAANIWKSETSTDDFVTDFDAKVQDQFGQSLRQKIGGHFGVDEEQANRIIDSMRGNIDQGRFRFVLCMDNLEERLKNLILYINHNSKFDVYAVEFEFYRHDGMQIVKPQLYGAEVKKSVAASGEQSERIKWDERSFMNTVENNLPDAHQKAVRTLYNFCKKEADAISFGTGSARGSFIPRFYDIASRSMMTVYTDGTVSITTGYMDNTEEGHKKQKQLLQGLQNKVGIAISDTDKAHHSFSISVDTWSPRVDEFIQIIRELRQV